jgi:hypothetical protein
MLSPPYILSSLLAVPCTHCANSFVRRHLGNPTGQASPLRRCRCTMTASCLGQGRITARHLCRRPVMSLSASCMPCHAYVLLRPSSSPGDACEDLPVTQCHTPSHFGLPVSSAMLDKPPNMHLGGVHRPRNRRATSSANGYLDQRGPDQAGEFALVAIHGLSPPCSAYRRLRAGSHVKRALVEAPRLLAARIHWPSNGDHAISERLCRSHHARA